MIPVWQKALLHPPLYSTRSFSVDTSHLPQSVLASSSSPLNADSNTDNQTSLENRSTSQMTSSTRTTSVWNQHPDDGRCNRLSSMSPPSYAHPETTCESTSSQSSSRPREQLQDGQYSVPKQRQRQQLADRDLLHLSSSLEIPLDTQI